MLAPKTAGCEARGQEDALFRGGALSSEIKRLMPRMPSEEMAAATMVVTTTKPGPVATGVS